MLEFLTKLETFQLRFACSTFTLTLNKSMLAGLFLNFNIYGDFTNNMLTYWFFYTSKSCSDSKGSVNP